MKKAILTIVLVLFLCPHLICFAVDNAEVYAEKVYAKENSVFFVPVYINNNPGLMGFKVTLTYDSKVISYPNISRGTVTQTGNFNDSIGVSNDGAIDIVWNADGNVTEDGTLFVVSFNTNKVIASETSIKLKYSKADTFNEEYEDVELSCKDIIVSFEEKPSETGTSGVSADRPANSEDIASTVDNVLEGLGISSIDDLNETQQEEFIKAVNERLKQITSSDEDVFSSGDELKDTYQSAIREVYVESVLSCVDTADIGKTMKTALKTARVKELKDINDKNKQAFVEAFINGIAKLSPDVYEVEGKLSSEDMLNAIKEIQTGCDKANEGESVPGVRSKSNPQIMKQVFAILCGTMCLAVLILIIVIILKCHRKKEMKHYKNTDGSDESDEKNK